jgi:hypothetical protein
MKNAFAFNSHPFVFSQSLNVLPLAPGQLPHITEWLLSSKFFSLMGPTLFPQSFVLCDNSQSFASLSFLNIKT